MGPAADERPRILIVEDYPTARDGLSRFFKAHGWEPTGVADALEAHRFINSSTPDPPDVYLIDLRLPGDPGPIIIGIIRLAGLRSRRTGLPVRVVGYTALDDDDDQVRAAIDAGADAILFKPADFDKLVDVVRGDHPGDVPIPPRGA